MKSDTLPLLNRIGMVFLFAGLLILSLAEPVEGIQIPSGKVLPKIKAIGRSLKGQLKADSDFLYINYLEIFEMYVEDLTCSFRLEKGNILIFSNIEAAFYGGKITGEVRVTIDDVTSYRVELEFTDVDFGWFAMNLYDPGENFRGDLGAVLKISGNDDGEVHGTLDINLENGYLLKLPKWFTTFTLVNINPFRSSVISEASANITLGKDGFDIKKVEMSTHDVDIYGTGKISYEGDADIVFNPVGKHRFLKSTLVLMPVAVFWQMLEKGIWRIHLKGPIFSMKYRISPLYRL